jgi:hypothetical protein
MFSKPTQELAVHVSVKAKTGRQTLALSSGDSTATLTPHLNTVGNQQPDCSIHDGSLQNKDDRRTRDQRSSRPLRSRRFELDRTERLGNFSMRCKDTSQRKSGTRPYQQQRICIMCLVRFATVESDSAQQYSTIEFTAGRHRSCLAETNHDNYCLNG